MKNSTTTIRWLIVIGLLGAVVAFFALGWQHQFTLDALKARQHALDVYRQAHPWLLGAGFFLIYVTLAALSLPAATLLTLAGGALFGLLEGTLLVSFASSIGATQRSWPAASCFATHSSSALAADCARSMRACNARVRSTSSHSDWFR